VVDAEMDSVALDRTVMRCSMLTASRRISSEMGVGAGVGVGVCASALKLTKSSAKSDHADLGMRTTL
jgi:hypothetical protein